MSENTKIVKKSTSPKKSAEPDKKIVAKKSSEPAKKIVNKIPSPESKPTSDTTDEQPTEAETPESVNVAGWKKKLEIEKANLMPRSLKPKTELWDKKKAEKKTEGKRKKGLVIFIYAKPKAGKSRFGLTSSQFEGFTGKKRILPKGYPTYVLDTENAVEDEAEINFVEQVNQGKIIIENCFIENPLTKEIEPIKSMEKIEEWAYSLEKEENGTLVIDTFTDYCEFAYYKLVDKVLGIKFNEDGKEKKAVMPMQYKWKTKKIVSFLRSLRNFKMNIILIAHAKDEYIKTGDGAMDFAKTGKIIANALDDADYWVDIVAVMDKVSDDDGTVHRKFVVTESRFETKDMKGMEYTLEEDISLSALVDLFKTVL